MSYHHSAAPVVIVTHAQYSESTALQCSTRPMTSAPTASTATKPTKDDRTLRRSVCEAQSSQTISTSPHKSLAVTGPYD